MTKKRQKFTIVLGLLVLSRFVMHRIRPSALIRAREQVTKAELTKVGLSQEVFDDLPRQSFHGNGRPMEPMNVILVGTEEQVLRSMLAAGWYEADPVSFANVMRAWVALATNRQYLTGPVTPLFADGHMHVMGFQKPTELNKFRQRHHCRIWSTSLLDQHGHRLWIMHASYDISFKGSGIFSFPPAHTIEPNIDKERAEVVQDLKQAGAKLRGYIQFQNAHEGVNAFNDEFSTDGRAAVLELNTSLRGTK
jgi:hypothetical protein